MQKQKQKQKEKQKQKCEQEQEQKQKEKQKKQLRARLLPPPASHARGERWTASSARLTMFGYTGSRGNTRVMLGAAVRAKRGRPYSRAGPAMREHTRVSNGRGPHRGRGARACKVILR